VATSLDARAERSLPELGRGSESQTRACKVIRLFVVARTRLYREGIARALDEDDRFHVSGTAADLSNAIDTLAHLTVLPEVVLIDHAIAEGAEAVRHLHRASPELRVLALAVREAEGDVLPWAEAGAAGFVSHDASFDDLTAGVTAVAEGWGLCSPRVARVLLNRVASLAAKRRPTMSLEELTRREREVALLLEEGLSNKEIAHRLWIQVATVKNHVHSILEKLEVQGRGEAASVVRATEI
jgi:two-component system nitrate/nitrite response regulator NarL